MSATALGALAAAGALGVTHALEPDHVAGISSLTSRHGDSRLSAFVGVCFSAGHVALVVLWLLVAYALLGQTSFPPILDTAGTVAVAVLLGAFGTLLAVRGYRAAASAHATDHEHAHATDHKHARAGNQEHTRATRGEHDDGHADDTEPHVHLPLVGDAHSHDHTTRAYLKTGLVGALFTLSPPLSMLAFLGTVIPTQGFPVATLSVGAYAVGITLTMGAIGASVGGLFGLASRHRRTFGAARLVTGVAVVGLALWLLAGTGLLTV